MLLSIAIITGSVENLKRITEPPKRFHVFGHLIHDRRAVCPSFDKQILRLSYLPELAYVVVHHVAYDNVSVFGAKTRYLVQSGQYPGLGSLVHCTLAVVLCLTEITVVNDCPAIVDGLQEVMPRIP